MKEKGNSSKQILLSVLGVAILIVAVVGVSFAAFTYSKLGDQVNTLTTGVITMNFEEGNVMTINNAMPTDDETGKTLTDTFTFKVMATATGTATINYDVAAVKEADSTLRDEDVKLYLTKGAEETQQFAPGAYVASADTSVNGAPVGSMVLVTDSFTTTGGALNETRDYTLRMWVNKDIPADQMLIQRTFKVRVGVYAKQA